ncbi:MAG: hypothetical protein CVT92_17320 [Bacteroidetes bacterium HGW-Bacteroidetes-1]|jgi:hypothetical protein|nr:MAG: hypothetical protein CVT92_17320 [Bacteroidetes bacterium HGW-Bacteroidetes-1]
MKFHFALLVIILVFVFSSCEKTTSVNPDSTVENGWLVEAEKLIINENSHDRIPSIDNPIFVHVDEVTINPNEEVFVYQTENQLRIYPLNTIWSHEIINDKDEESAFAISYCPITGSGIAWNRLVDGYKTTFGVSGHLYNNNLVPYDRETGSYWSQMKLEGIKGLYGGNELEFKFMLHTVYSTAILAYPDAVVLFDSTYAHSCDSICLPPTKSEQVGSSILSNYFGVVVRDEVLLFASNLFTPKITIFHTHFKGLSLVIAGSYELGFTTAFINSNVLTFHAINGELPDIMRDNEGNTYDLMGNITNGPKKGQRLNTPFAYSAKEFAWKLFFDQIQNYQN